MNTKHKGNICLANAIKYYTCLGYDVSLPLTESSKYDLIIDDGECLHKVQCKYTSMQENSGSYRVPLYVSGGNRSSGNYKNCYNKTDFDILYVTCANNVQYAIPHKNITSTTTISLGQSAKYEQYKTKNTS